MEFKVGNLRHVGSEEAPMMLTLTEEDRRNIARMPPGATRYAAVPDDWSDEEVDAWMDDPGELRENAR